MRGVIKLLQETHVFCRVGASGGGGGQQLCGVMQRTPPTACDRPHASHYKLKVYFAAAAAS